jgi:hypothetical protein
LLRAVEGYTREENNIILKMKTSERNGVSDAERDTVQRKLEDTQGQNKGQTNMSEQEYRCFGHPRK